MNEGLPVFRCGIGYDIHAFIEDRELWLGGVMIPYPKGLDGFSDADVLLHAVIDAILGAAGMEDIGVQFPPGNPAYQRIPSLKLLNRTKDMVTEAGWKINNVDCMIVAEEPRIGPYRDMIRDQIANTLEVQQSLVNVKAVSPEGLGSLGKAQGIAAQAVAMLVKDSKN